MAATTTTTKILTDSLLDDLDDLSDINEQNDEEEYEEKEEMLQVTQENVSELKIKENRKKLLDDPKLKSHLEFIRVTGANLKKDYTMSEVKEKEESDYRLIVESNHFLSKLSNEYANTFSNLCRAYEPKFPELEDLIIDPKMYKNAVRVIGNEMDMTKINDALNLILNSNQIITISVAGSTTNGKPLNEIQLKKVEEIVDSMDKMEMLQNELIKFVESKMEHLAPNVCVLVGATIAARLLGLAGGLAELSKIPACNLQVIGHIQNTATSRGGMSELNSKSHLGILCECDLVQRCSKYLHRKAVKTVASKLALAARCDYVNAEAGRTRSNVSGKKFLLEIEQKMKKLEEPDKAPVLKALPKPDLMTKKRRGGKRIRRLKERFQETDMMKQANKRSFNTEVGEYGDDAMGLTLGMLDTQNAASGHILQKTIQKKMRIANTKSFRKKLKNIKMSTSSNSGNNAGTVSSMVFTPVQGLELVNPDASRKKQVDEANRKWFSEDAGFLSALPK